MSNNQHMMLMLGAWTILFLGVGVMSLHNEHTDFKRSYDNAERMLAVCDHACQDHQGVASIQLLIHPWCACRDGAAYD